MSPTERIRVLSIIILNYTHIIIILNYELYLNM